MNNYTQKTLLQQLQISELEVDRRKELLGFTQDDVGVLKAFGPVLEQNIDAIVADFYKKQIAQPENALLIGDADTLARLHSAQRAYVLNLFEGVYGLDYVNNRLRIGMVHKRIGVEPKLYLAAVRALRSSIADGLRSHTDAAGLERVLDALDKLLYFDVTLVFDTYIRGLLSEVESAKDKALSYAMELEHKVAERTRQLQELSQRDALTGLFNRRSFYELLEREIRQARRGQTRLAVLFVDVDKFKPLNDSQGHRAGDTALRSIAEVMLLQCREIDVVSRYGGDEFCIALPNCDADFACQVAQRICSDVRTCALGVTLSIGVAETGPLEFLATEELVALADARMYQAKLGGGDTICA